MPFINQHQNSSNLLLWSDLASSHYASSVTQFLEDKNIHLVSKEKNLQNCLQAQPVKTFWVILEEKVYADVGKRKRLNN